MYPKEIKIVTFIKISAHQLTEMRVLSYSTVFSIVISKYAEKKIKIKEIVKLRRLRDQDSLSFCSFFS